jgi:hypothetical protein
MRKIHSLFPCFFLDIGMRVLYNYQANTARD